MNTDKHESTQAHCDHVIAILDVIQVKFDCLIALVENAKDTKEDDATADKGGQQ